MCEIPMIPRRFVWLLDVLTLGLAFIAAYALVPALHSLLQPGNPARAPALFLFLSPAPGLGRLPPIGELVWTYGIMTAAALPVLTTFSDYGELLRQSRARIIFGSWLAALFGAASIALVVFALKDSESSRLFVATYALVSGLGFGVYRLLLRHYFLLRQRSGSYARNVLLVGQQPAVAGMARHFAQSISPNDYRLLGYMGVPEGEPSPLSAQWRSGPTEAAAEDLPDLGQVETLGDLLISRPVHEVIAIQPSSNGAWIEGVIRDCEYLGVLLRIVPQALLREQRTLRTLYPFAALNLPAVVLAPPHWNSDALFIKRMFDILVSGILLALLSPLFLVVALAIKKAMPGYPVFYPWRVVGQSGVEFTGYKFTTMVIDADERKADLMPQNEMTGPVFKMKDDPRTTPLGRFLRKYSINELPQLWSVLKGDMSLVGPRPAFRHELERYEFWHKRKLSIRPGITCLWQIRGRNAINSFDDWVHMDLEYVDKWSLWLDLRILMRTIGAVFAGTGY